MKLKGTVFIALLLSAFAFAALPTIKPTNAQTTKLYLHPSTITTNPPATFTVDLKIDDVTNLRAWDIVIRWDPDIIKLQDIEEGTFLNGSGQPTEFHHELFLEYELSAAGLIVTPNVGVSGSGVLATLTFKCIDTGDPFDIIFMSSLLIDKDNEYISHEAIGAHVITRSPVIKFTRTVTTDVSGQRATAVDPAPGDTVVFDGRLSYPQPKFPADIDRSGRVDVGDAGEVGSAWFTREGHPMWNPAADIDGSGRVDLGDAGLVGANWFVTGNKIVKWRWDFGDGTVIEGPGLRVVSHVYNDYSDEDGFTVNLTLTDNYGNSWSKTQQVRIWRDVAAIDVWPCYDDYLGMESVMNNDVMMPGTILFITAAYRNMGTLKQTYKAEIYLRNTETGETITLFTRTRSNVPPEGRSSLWFVPHYTYMGIEVNDPNLHGTLSSSELLMFVDYDEDGYYTWGGCERPIWDTDGSGNVTEGDIAIVEGFVIGAEDPDIGMPLTFDPLLKWFDSNGNGAADIGERVYYDMDEDGTVSDGDFYVWLEEYYYGVIYDVEIHEIPAGTYVMGLKVTAIMAPVDLDPTNDVFEYSAVFTVVNP